MSDQYDIFFAGKIADGFDEATVRANLARMFKANDDTVDQLFSGKLQAIKRGVDRDTAVKYRAAMLKAGAVPVIRAHGGAEDRQASAAPPPEPQPTMVERVAALAAESESPAAGGPATAPAQAETDLSLAPAGTDVLREDEREEFEELDIDTSALGLASVFDDSPLQEPVEQPPAPDTSHLSMGAAGESIPTLDEGIAPLDPDTSLLSMGELGEDIPTLDTPVTLLDPDTDGIELAPEGSDVLEPEYRKKDPVAPPPTDHLSLED